LHVFKLYFDENKTLVCTLKIETGVGFFLCLLVQDQDRKLSLSQARENNSLRDTFHNIYDNSIFVTYFESCTREKIF